MTLTFYYLESTPPSRSVDLVIHALGLSPEYKTLNLYQKEHLTPEFRKLNPLHTVPAIDDDGFILWESRAIMTYLISKYGKDDSLYPKDIKKRALVDQKLHYNNDVFSIISDISKGIYFLKLKSIPEKMLARVKEAQENVEKLFGGNDFIAGNSLTVADYSYITIMDILALFSPMEDKFPNTKKWMDRCQSVMKDFEKVNKKGAERMISFLKENLSL